MQKTTSLSNRFIHFLNGMKSGPYPTVKNDGIKNNYLYAYKDELRFYGGKEGVTPFIEFNVPKVATELDKFPLGLPNARFYKVQ